MKRKFTFQGPVQSGVTFGRGENAVDVRLIPGRVVELDDDKGWVKSSIAKGHLVPIADSLTEPAVGNPPEPPKAGTVVTVNNKPPSGAGANEVPKGDGKVEDETRPKGDSATDAQGALGGDNKKNRKGS